MAQVFVPSFRKRVMLGALDLFARVTGMRAPEKTGLEGKPVERILVIELWNIGDIVLAMPFLSQLRARFPQATITMLARPYARAVLAGTDLVNEFIDTELGWSESSVKRNAFAYHWGELARVRRELKHRSFDLAFSSRMHVREHVLLALSGARRRVAFALGHGDGVLTDAIPIENPNRHKVDDWFELLKPFGSAVDQDAPRLRVSDAERNWATSFLARRGVSTEARLVAIHPGASVPEKRWPLERFAQVATAVAQMPDMKVVAFVAPDGYGEQLSRVPGVIAAKVNLREMIALLDCCDLLVCNDSGPMHIAGALGVPTVSIFGSGINRWFSPLGDGHRLLSARASVNGSQTTGDLVTPFDVAGVATADVLDTVREALGVRATVQP